MTATPVSCCIGRLTLAWIDDALSAHVLGEEEKLPLIKTYSWTVFNITEQHWGSEQHRGSSAQFRRSMVFLLCSLCTPVSSSLPLLTELLTVHWHQVECPSHQGETWRHRTSTRPNRSTTEPDHCGIKPIWKSKKGKQTVDWVCVSLTHLWRINMWINEAKRLLKINFMREVWRKQSEGGKQKPWQQLNACRQHGSGLFWRYF